MTDPAIVTIVSKSLAAFLLICGGLYAIYVGQKLFRDGVGIRAGKSEITILNQVKLTTTSVGGGLMLTAVAWGWLGSHSLPVYSQDAGKREVSQLSPAKPNFLQLLGPEIAFSPDKSTLDPEQRPKIDELANQLKNSGPGPSNIVIRVSTPITGWDTQRNLDIAQARADTIKAALVKAGVKLTGVTTLAGPYGRVGAVNVGILKGVTPPPEPKDEAFKPNGGQRS